MADKSETISKKAGCGNIHVTITDGEKPIVSIKAGKSGTCLSAFTMGMGYCLTVALQHGASVQELAEAFENVYCPQSLALTKGPASCPDAISQILRAYAKDKK